MLARAEFLHGLAAGATTVATGGLDVWSADAQQIRVLVAGDARGETPQVFPDGTFGFAGKRWRGAPSTIGMPDGRFQLVTTIDVDAYLRGVVPLEASPSWPAGALQAQAIVARTFALARRSLSRPYDVRSDDADQHWGGVDAEAAGSTAAIDATRGQTLQFGGGPAAVFYSSCCGGHTADVAATWGSTPLSYLRGVGDPHCVPAPDYRWTRAIALDRVLAAFGARTGGTLAAAAPVDLDESGRPHGVRLDGTQSVTVPVAEFRRVLGADIVRSTWLRALRIDPAPAGPSLTIEGSGRGHGVGLCQWGARYFAAAGAPAAQILAFYFPGTAIRGG